MTLTGRHLIFGIVAVAISLGFYYLFMVLYPDTFFFVRLHLAVLLGLGGAAALLLLLQFFGRWWVLTRREVLFWVLVLSGACLWASLWEFPQIKGEQQILARIRSIGCSHIAMVIMKQDGRTVNCITDTETLKRFANMLRSAELYYVSHELPMIENIEVEIVFDGGRVVYPAWVPRLHQGSLCLEVWVIAKVDVILPGGRAFVNP